jgi:hypothetical protein
MCRHHCIIHCAVLVGCLSSSVACNSLLGVDDISTLMTDAAVDCHSQPNFQMLSSATSTTTLFQFKDNIGTGPELDLMVAAGGDSKRSTLIMRLYNGSSHGVLNAPGTYSLLPADAQFPPSCGICISLQVDFRTPLEAGIDVYNAFGMGTLILMKADSIGMTGSLHNLKFRPVDDNDEDVNNGCFITMEDVEFDAVY